MNIFGWCRKQQLGLCKATLNNNLLLSILEHYLVWTKKTVHYALKIRKDQNLDWSKLEKIKNPTTNFEIWILSENVLRSKKNWPNFDPILTQFSPTTTKITTRGMPKFQFCQNWLPSRTALSVHGQIFNFIVVSNLL